MPSSPMTPSAGAHNFTPSRVGLGLFKVPADFTQELVEKALDVGYRHFDCASAYGNETELGLALLHSGLPRESFTVTSKAWIDEQGRDRIPDALRRSLDRLRLERVDLYMIHWPAPAQDLYVESFASMVGLRDQGLIDHVAVSNFHIDYLERLRNELGVLPVMNQVERHPYLQQEELLAYHSTHGIASQAWAPLARAEILSDSTLDSLAEQESITVPQLVLAWHLSKDVSVIPKASSRERLRENFEAATISLRPDTIQAFAALERNYRVGPDPREKN